MEKLRAMWDVLMGRGVLYNVRVRAGDSNDNSSFAVGTQGKAWVTVNAVGGNLVTVHGRSSLG